MYRYDIKQREDIPSHYLMDDQLNEAENQIRRRKFRQGNSIKEVWIIIHFLANKTLIDGHCPYKDYLKNEAFKLLNKAK